MSIATPIFVKVVTYLILVGSFMASTEVASSKKPCATVMSTISGIRLYKRALHAQRTVMFAPTVTSKYSALNAVITIYLMQKGFASQRPAIWKTNTLTL